MKSEWISVKDETPDFGEDVWIYAPEIRKATIGSLKRLDSSGLTWERADGFEGNRVTYWMPLVIPSPPRG